MTGLLRSWASRPVSALLLCIGIVVGAVYCSLVVLNIDFSPAGSKRAIVIRTPWPGRSAEAVLVYITEPLRNRLTQYVEEIDSVRTLSSAGFSEITLRVPHGSYDLSTRTGIREAVDDAALALPRDAGHPEIITEEFANSVFAEARFVVPPGGDPVRMQRVVSDVVVPAVSSIDGIRSCEMQCASNGTEIQLAIDRPKCMALGLSVADVLDRIRRSCGGDLLRITGTAEGELNVILERDVPDTKTIQQTALFVLPGTGRVVTVGDLASIRSADVGGVGVNTANGRSVCTITLSKHPQSNILTVASRTKRECSRILSLHCPRVSIQWLRDDSGEIRRAIFSLMRQMLISLAAMLALLYIFTFDARLTFLCMSSVFLGSLASIILFSILGISLNLTSMNGLAVSWGISADAAIVLALQVRRHHTLKGGSIGVASGAERALWPIVGSVLTTAAAFLPVYFALTSEVDQAFGDFVLALTVSLVATMITAPIVILPAYGKAAPVVRRRSGRGRLTVILNKAYFRYFRGARRFRGALALIFVLAVGLPLWKIPERLSPPSVALPQALRTGLSLVCDGYNRISMSREGRSARRLLVSLTNGLLFRFFDEVPMRLTPESVSGDRPVSVNAELPEDISRTVTYSLGRNVERYAGGQARGDCDVSFAMPADNRFEVVMRNAEATGIEKRSLARSLSLYMQSTSGEADYWVTAPDFEVSSTRNETGRYTIRIVGPDFQELKTTLRGLRRRLAQNKRVQNISTSMERRRVAREMQFTFGGNGAFQRSVDVSPAQIASEIVALVSPPTASLSIDYDGRVVRLVPVLGGQTMTRALLEESIAKVGRAVTMDAVGSLGLTDASSWIRSSNGMFQADATFSYHGQPNFATSFVRRIIKEARLPDGFTIDDGHPSSSSSPDILVWFVIPGFLVITIMTLLFNSLRYSLLAFVPVAFGVFGYLCAFVLTARPVDVGGMAAFVLVVGLSANNGILIIDEIVRRGHRAAADAASAFLCFRRRLMPLLITSTLTIVGVLPWCFEPRDGFFRSLGTGVVGGILGGTLLSLVIFPAFLGVRPAGAAVRKGKR